jgi:hypothetical protein
MENVLYQDTTSLSRRMKRSLRTAPYRFQYAYQLLPRSQFHHRSSSSTFSLGAHIPHHPAPGSSSSSIKALTTSNLSTHTAATQQHSGDSSFAPTPARTKKPGNASMISKPLTEVPPSNKKLFLNLKKSGRNVFNNYCWSSSAIPPFHYIPPLAPMHPIPTADNYEKKAKLAKILAESDSEEEILIIPNQYSGGKIL